MALLGQVDTETGRAFPAKSDVWYPLGRPRIKDLAAGDATLKGFNGCFTDGQYGYFIPSDNPALTGHGKIARLDLRDFTTVTSLDLASVNPAYVWYTEGCTDGRYGYAIPFGGGMSMHGYLVRFDLANFTTGGVTVVNLTAVNANLLGFNGGFTDGRYLYCVPFLGGTYIARIDLNNFAAGGVSYFDFVSSQYVGGCTDGQYGYMAPSDGIVARFSLSNFAIGSKQTINLNAIDSDLYTFIRCFTDFRYVYLIPNSNGSLPSGKVVRIDINNFTASGVSILNLATVDAQLVGFSHGYCDGRYGYFTPATYGKVARVDLTNFTISGVDVVDLKVYDAEMVYCRGGFLDKTYAYFVGYSDAAGVFGSRIGKVARIIATGFRSALG